MCDCLQLLKIHLNAAIACQTNAYRLVYSEGDLLPSLIVDVYDNVLVLQTLSHLSLLAGQFRFVVAESRRIRAFSIR